MLKKYCIIVVFFIHVVSAWGVPGAFRNLSMGDGLSDLLVNAIYKDSLGFIWIGTANCLDRFDGTAIRHYRFAGTEMNKMRVSAIVETRGKRLWCGNGLGLWCLNRETDQLERKYLQQMDCPVQALAETPEGQLLVGTVQGLYICKGDSLQHILLDQNILSSVNSIIGINIDEAGLIWLATLQGLVAYDRKTGGISRYQYKQQTSPFDRLSGITRIGKILYLGTTHAGLLKFDTESRIFSKYIEVGNGIISSISSDGKDILYVATDGDGIHFVSQAANQVIRTLRYNPDDKESIHSNSVYSLLVDRDGIIWVGMYSAGLDYSLYQRDIFQVYSFGNFTTRNLPVRSFYIRPSEKLIGTREGLYYISESDRKVWEFKKEKGIPNLRSNLILSLGYYEGEYYIGTYGGGLSVFNPKSRTFRNLNESPTFMKGHIFQFQQDAQGNLWIATSEGVHRYRRDTRELQTFNNSNSQLPEGNSYFILFDRTGRGWIATDYGLAIFDPASQTVRTNVFPQDFAISKEKIRYIYEAKDGDLYFIPDKGNYFVSDPTMQRYGYVSPAGTLQGSSFLTLTEDDQGYYWASRNHGIVRGDKTMQNYFTFNYSDGLPDPVFIAFNCYKDEQGMMWWGNTKGLVKVDPRQVDSLTIQDAPMVITDLFLNGEPADASVLNHIEQNQEVDLEHNHKNIRFRFAALSYSNPESMIYEYRLEGYDTAWIRGMGKNDAMYYNLPSGNYTFRVRLTMGGTQEKAVALRIKPVLPVWALVLLIGLAGGIIVLSYRGYRIRKCRRDEDRRQLMEHKAAAEEHVHQEDEKYKNARISEDECRQICDRLLVYVVDQKPYINPDLKISDLAQAIGCSSHALSQVFNLHLHKSYYDFINDYRIDEFKVLANDPVYAKYTLTALSEKSGFSSRASFFRSFKKSTGITPNEYIQQLKG